MGVNMKLATGKLYIGGITVVQHAFNIGGIDKDLIILTIRKGTAPNLLSVVPLEEH